PLNSEDGNGFDWMDLAPDQCTFYYDSEGPDIQRYDQCTHTQLSNFNTTAFTGYLLGEIRILPNGDVLVADANDDYLLDPSGNIIETYSCTSMPGCQGLLYGVALDPDGTTFWAGDNESGYIYHIDLATGAVLKRIATTYPALFTGLSVEGQSTAASGVPEGGVLAAEEGWFGGLGTECPCLSTNGHHGEPVNPMDGDFYENDTDLSVPGP